MTNPNQQSDEIATDKPDPGWWQCDACNADVRPINAHTEEVPGGEGPVTLAFCEDCTEERR